MHPNKEIEVRFLDIDVDNVLDRLHQLHAQDKCEDFLREIIFYDKDRMWVDEQKFIRIRQSANKTVVTYKHQQSLAIDGTIEIEFEISDEGKVQAFLEALGLVAYRIQEKKRRTFFLDNVTIDIDTWPTIPTYVELEGKNEEEIKQVAEKLGFDWSRAIYENAKIVIEKYYNTPVSTFRYFTFDKVE